MYFEVFLLTILAYLSGGSQLRASPVNDKPKEFNYGVIADCGSSGTRVHIYRWDAALGYPELLEYIEPLKDNDGHPLTSKIKGGLAAVDPAGSVNYIKPLLEFITEHIPPEEIKKTGIYFLGTAGMRLLEEEIQSEIYKNIRDFIEKNYDFAKVETSVISGADEGMYQWINVNSKARQFDPNRRRSQRRTYAIIEMGGASAQVAYRLEPAFHEHYKKYDFTTNPDKVRAFDTAIVRPKISDSGQNYDYSVVSTTFLGLGSNSARLAYVDVLVAGRLHFYRYETINTILKSKQISISDPCLPRDSAEVVRKPIRMLEERGEEGMFGEEHTVGFNPENGEETFNVKLIGRGNYIQCKNLLKYFILTARDERMYCKDDEPCAMLLLGERFVPFNRFRFVGLGELFYTTKSMLEWEGEYSRDKILEKTREICHTPYPLLLQTYGQVLEYDKTRVLMECFKALWVDTFLVHGLKMSRDYNTLEMVRTPREKVDLDWTFGAVLDRALAIKEAANNR